MRDSDRLVILQVMRDGSITNSRAREVLKVDSVEARAHLGRLRDGGLLIQHGTRGRAYYTLGVIGPDRSADDVVLDAAASAPLTNARVRDLTGVDRYRAGQILRRLVEAGHLVQRGERRGTTYELP